MKTSMNASEQSIYPV